MHKICYTLPAASLRPGAKSEPKNTQGVCFIPDGLLHKDTDRRPFLFHSHAVNGGPKLEANILSAHVNLIFDALALAHKLGLSGADHDRSIHGMRRRQSW